MSIYAGLGTSVYIDGLNLHHGCLKGTSYERLDLGKFCKKLLQPLNVTEINYFISAPFGSHRKKQQYKSYIKALERIPEVNIVTGTLKPREKTGPNIKNPGDIVTIKVLEEKHTDVNLAVHLIDDSYQKKIDCAVIISNDIDMLGAMEMFRKRHPDKILGLIIPTHQWTQKELCAQANFAIRITDEHLEGCILP